MMVMPLGSAPLGRLRQAGGAARHSEGGVRIAACILRHTYCGIQLDMRCAHALKGVGVTNTQMGARRDSPSAQEGRGPIAIVMWARTMT